jgi:hypothetical protein
MTATATATTDNASEGCRESVLGGRVLQIEKACDVQMPPMTGAHGDRGVSGCAAVAADPRTRLSLGPAYAARSSDKIR